MIPILAVYTYEDRKCSSLSNLAAGTERDLVGKLIMWSHSDDKVRVVDDVFTLDTLRKQNSTLPSHSYNWIMMGNNGSMFPLSLCY